MVSPGRIKRGLLPALLLAILPGALMAQEPLPTPAPAPQGPPEELQVWLTELQQLHGRLEAIQQQALTDPSLSAAQEELGANIRAAMESIDPELEQGMTRIQALETEAAAAQQTGNQARLQEIGAEAQQIQQRFLSAQQQALQQPALAAQIEAFQDRLEARMREVDPSAEQLIARFQELEQKLSAAMQGGR